MKKSAHAMMALTLALPLALTLSISPALAQPLPAASPESVGFDSSRLKKLEDYMTGVVAEGRVAGITTLIARHGKLVHFKTYGQADLASRRPMNRDAIFRIYSMTKPMVGVAMMMLFEEGKWQLDDPVTKFIPEFKNLRVMTVNASGNITTEPARRPPTMREVMSHTAGFGYGLENIHPVDRAFIDKSVMPTTSQQQMIERMADIPLKFQPGEGWAYSIAVDIQGAIIEKLTGKSLGAFLDERLFKPLKMTDTAFRVSSDREGRLAQVYQGDPAGGKLAIATTGITIDILKPGGRENGGGGLYSTTADYARFAQMLANKGELDGARILSPVSIELMGTNVVSQEVLKSSGPQGFNEAIGFGLDFRIAMDPRRAGRMDGKGSIDWGGAAGTWFWVDPSNDLIFVGMVQRLNGGVEDLRPQSRVFTYQALIHPEK